ncbi:MAG: TonB-dependent receptor, partial [Cellvibrionaceae bacterium]|nr:TonB-dependent receptor [Cellvibrionaceae bacterium]
MLIQPSIRLSFLLPLLAAGGLAYGNEGESIEEVRVWGTQVKSSALKLDQEAIAIKQADHISDLLRTIPGVDVGGAHSLNQAVTIRTMDDKRFRVTIDGAVQNSYMYHHMGNLQIHADILETVDVNLGHNSVLQSGIGGNLRLRTKSADQLLQAGQRFGGRVQLNYGDNSGRGVALSGYGKISDELDFLLYHNWVEREDFEVGGGQLKDLNGQPLAGLAGKVFGVAGDTDDSLVKIGYQFSPSQQIKLGYERYRDEGDYSFRPDLGVAATAQISRATDTPYTWPSQFDRDTITLNYSGEFDNTSIEAAIYDNDSTFTRDERAWQYSSAMHRGKPAPEHAAIIEGSANNRGLNILATSDWGEHSFSYGGEYLDYETDYQANYLNGSQKVGSESFSAYSLYLQGRIALSDDFALTPGLRYDHHKMDSTIVNDSFKELSGALALEWQPSDTLLMKLSGSQLFEAPEIGETMLGAGLQDKPSPGIKAETGLNTELSLAYADAVMGADKLSAGFTLFNTNIEDFIYDRAEFKNIYNKRSDNIGDLTIKGVEAYIGYDIDAIELLFTIADVDSEVDAFAHYQQFDGAGTQHQQGTTYTLNIDYLFDAYDLSLHWDTQYVDSVANGKYLHGANFDNGKPSFTVHNISARWTPAELQGLSLTLGVDNLGDKYYASQSSRAGIINHKSYGQLQLFDYEPGRNIKL